MKTIKIPVISGHFSLAVFPQPASDNKVINSIKKIQILSLFIYLLQDYSTVFLYTNYYDVPSESGQYVFREFKPFLCILHPSQFCRREFHSQGLSEEARVPNFLQKVFVKKVFSVHFSFLQISQMLNHQKEAK